MCITQFISHIVIHSNLFTVTDLDMVIFVFPAIGSRFFFSFFSFFLINFLIGGLEFSQETRVNLMQTGH